MRSPVDAAHTVARSPPAQVHTVAGGERVPRGPPRSPRCVSVVKVRRADAAFDVSGSLQGVRREAWRWLRLAVARRNEQATSAVVHAVALARFVLTHVRGRCANSRVAGTLGRRSGRCTEEVVALRRKRGSFERVEAIALVIGHGTRRPSGSRSSRFEQRAGTVAETAAVSGDGRDDRLVGAAARRGR